MSEDVSVARCHKSMKLGVWTWLRICKTSQANSSVLS